MTGPRRVVATITGRGDKNLVDVTIDTDGSVGTGTATVVATGGHPVWVDAESQWINAVDVRPHDRLRTVSGAHTEVFSTRQYKKHHTVYNLTIQDIHTYYVLAGRTPILVHNSDWRCSDASDIARGHADRKHGLEFPGMSAKDLETHVGSIMRNPLDSKDLNRGRKAYLGRDGMTVIIHDPMNDDSGTVLRRTIDDVDEYWEGLK